MAYLGQTVTIQLGDFGLLTDVTSGQVPKGALIRANNISLETGYVTKAPGSLRYNSTQVLPAGIVAIADWHPEPFVQRLIALCANGSLYRDIGDRIFSGATAINTGLGTPTPRSMFVQGGNETASRSKKLFLFTDGLNQVKVLDGDGTSFATIATPAADWVTPKFPRFGFVHRNRLWAFMGQRSYASATGNHEDFVTGVLTDNIFPGEGGDLIGGQVFKGRAFVFKEGGFVYFLDDTDPDSDNWNWRRLSSNFGLSSPHGIVEILNDMIAVSESGSPISYAATEAFGDIESADLLRQLQIENYYRKNISMSGLDVTHAIYYEAKKQVFFTGRTGYRTTNNTLFVIDFNKQNPRPVFWPKDQADCLALRRDANTTLKPMYGSADGYVYLMDQEDRLVGGSGYTAEFMTGHYDFRDMGPAAHKNKLFDFLAVEFKPQGLWNLEIDVYIDGKFSETINYLMDVRDDGLDDFTLDTDPLGREEAQTIQKPLHGSGRRISFLCRGTGANQNFAIASLTVGFRMGAEQATRV